MRTSAVRWLRRAVKLALERYEVDECILLLERAVELAQEDELAAIWIEIGNANALKYDGEGFWTALQRALEHSQDSATTAKAYSDLAFQASIRGGMWKVFPDNATVNAWIDRALELIAA